MWAKVTSIGLKGMEGYRVHVEVGCYTGMDSFKIVGLPDAAVKESRERIHAALRSLGYVLAGQKIIVNLSPAEQRKSGPMFDVPMAIALLLSLQELEITIPEGTGFVGALSLDGAVQPVEGMLPAVLTAKSLGIRKLYLPISETFPHMEIPGLQLIYVDSLQDIIAHLKGNPLKRSAIKPAAPSSYIDYPDFKQIIGHSKVKAALEVAAAGEHHVFMMGPPGCGKSLLAESFPSILPALTKEAQLEVLSLYQLSGNDYQSLNTPPFRNPHHSASGISIIGGGQYPKPGEISLAHHGVLFLDEMGEFSKKTLDMLRQPLEKGRVTISRTRSTITYPASFILIAAMNPCPCGYSGSATHYCTCSPRQKHNYQSKISGPLRDRFDIQLFIRQVDFKREEGKQGESSEIIRSRVEEARKRQYKRFGKEISNGRVSYEMLLKKSPLTKDQQQRVREVSIESGWSNRTQIKLHRLARTISDLKGHPDITDHSIVMAIELNSPLGHV